MSGGGYLCGTIFSFVGFVFLVVVGSLLKLQPMYILNAKTPNSGANACFEAAMLYAVALVVCYTMWRKEKLRAGELDFLSDSFSIKRERAFYGSEDSDEELPLAKNMSPTPRMV
ncbi:hypothetical protein F441_19132 [Phytophthora nicotianae CJ01A1]|uniref:Uncharacterized protein n=6 Tax=Phytophthora nicotianae TaxID=4792 RepID=W2QXI3_PHYN3|nr:hypothetical protein PPTG_05409 [Phytophthora nicotianae INRA-310]ETI34104.1 hypothetical protein F443_19312 [Phytophthora nicotianae P1569]ETK74471.1 hypothetical protein L915_18736 [Phytophthora nicotianae]ETO62913.1 hypothetical protein F444_19263 [Phytophthora nicotianae P1976]ETP03996.1 hypothetical protein F441_19132 [Phytophthora nicotianae CJ01A1]ETP32150.1 hypothetical protein F442_19087 [Phytophthora nicotianae P10297]